MAGHPVEMMWDGGGFVQQEMRRPGRREIKERLLWPPGGGVTMVNDCGLKTHAPWGPRGRLRRDAVATRGIFRIVRGGLAGEVHRAAGR